MLEATEELLAEGASFADLGIERIATRAGISRTAFYFYFADKRELLMRLTEEVNALLFEQADIWFSGEATRRTSCATALANIAALYDEHTVLLRAIVEVSTYDEEVAVFWRSTLGRFVDATRAPHRGGARAPGRARRSPGARDGVRADLDDRAHALPAARPGTTRAAGRPRRGADRDLAAQRLRRRAADVSSTSSGWIASNCPVSRRCSTSASISRSVTVGARAAQPRSRQAPELQDLEHVDEVDAARRATSRPISAITIVQPALRSPPSSE